MMTIVVQVVVGFVLPAIGVYAIWPGHMPHAWWNVPIGFATFSLPVLTSLACSPRVRRLRRETDAERRSHLKDSVTG
jgi:hypothetical protein